MNTPPRETCQEIGFKGFLVTCGFGDDVDTLAGCSQKRVQELWSLIGIITSRYGATWDGECKSCPKGHRSHSIWALELGQWILHNSPEVSLQLLQILFNQQDQHTIVSLKFGEEGSADFMRPACEKILLDLHLRHPHKSLQAMLSTEVKLSRRRVFLVHLCMTWAIAFFAGLH